MEPDEQYARVRELFRAAESRLKTVERLGGETLIPAINELRYVAYHVLESLACEDEHERDKHLQEAEFHAIRARYDSAEAAIIELITEFDQFVDDFRLIPITDVVSDYLEMCEVVDEARDAIEDLEGRNHVDRHEEFTGHFDKLTAILRRLRPAREELKKKLRNRDLTVGSLYLAGIAILVMIVVGIATIYVPPLLNKTAPPPATAPVKAIAKPASSTDSSTATNPAN